MDKKLSPPIILSLLADMPHNWYLTTIQTAFLPSKSTSPKKYLNQVSQKYTGEYSYLNNADRGSPFTVYLASEHLDFLLRCWWIWGIFTARWVSSLWLPQESLCIWEVLPICIWEALPVLLEMCLTIYIYIYI